MLVVIVLRRRVFVLMLGLVSGLDLAIVLLVVYLLVLTSFFLPGWVVVVVEDGCDAMRKFR